KCRNLVGFKLLLVEPYYGEKKNIFVAADTMGAGIGELVLVTTDNTTQFAIDRSAPVDAFVVGIVDAPPQLGK
ncbi:MAG: ethanolamine utilization protein EutN, partial [Paenibacillaceae bacterium]|nr:ethanolamine utilization protein EutN [Paenibacillaceae bacterium]